MKDLFYFPQESLLCWVAGYTRDGNASKVFEMIADLKENAETFAKAAKIKFEDVRTEYIYQSRRYKNMRIFYAKIESENVPKEAYSVGNSDWTMGKWLAD